MPARHEGTEATITHSHYASAATMPIVKRSGHPDIPCDVTLQVSRADAKIAERRRNDVSRMIAQQHERGGPVRVIHQCCFSKCQ